MAISIRSFLQPLWSATILSCVLLPGVVIAAEQQAQAALWFLAISPSARVNGLGQSGVALPDEALGYYNPAATALFARNHFLSGVRYTGKTRWVPRLSEHITYAYSGIQAGFDLSTWRSMRQRVKSYPFLTGGPRFSTG